MAKSKQVEIWTTVSSDDIRAGLPSLGKARVEVSRVQLTTVSKNLMEFLTEFQSVFEIPANNKSGFDIDEIELNLGINSSGGIAMIGKLEVGIHASMKIKLKRRKNSL